MISRFTTPSGTETEVPGERAPANRLQTHHFQPDPEVRSLPIPNPAPRRSQVKRIAVRFASQPPHSARNPGVRHTSVRKSLTLNPEIKAHTA
jgi:hypothetical protein